jgi:hypothetical protein
LNFDSVSLLTGFISINFAEKKTKRGENSGDTRSEHSKTFPDECFKQSESPMEQPSLKIKISVPKRKGDDSEVETKKKVGSRKISTRKPEI